VDIARPKTRADCGAEQRPCPWVACKHHLYLDINPETGSIKINFPDLEVWELRDTCALDVAERGGITLDEVGLVTNLTRERIRQLEVRGLLKLKSVSRELR
ncbi:MAG: DNA-binding protein, partial [Deltaproteobacteria bacterium]|nr:DNA-binding protein [Deltaproteobacteria bacterium]